MIDEIIKFSEQFPIVEYDPNRLEPPQVNLMPHLLELFEIVGYNNKNIHENVNKNIPEDAYEPTDIDYLDTIQYPIYISDNVDESAHIVAYESIINPPLSELNLNHADYEQMRVHHEAANADLTICLTPYDLLLYEGQPLFAGQSAEAPITSYPLHEGLKSVNAKSLLDDLESPAHLS